MAFAIDTYTGNGSTTSFSITFPYIEQAHVIVTVDGVTKTLTTHYTFSNSSTISFGTAPAASTVIKITRSSNRTARLVDYQDGSTLTEATLDQDANQAFFMAQEAIDITENSLNLDASNLWDAGSKRIINVATPTGTNDAVTKAYVDSVAGSATAAASSETAAANSATAAANAQAAAEAALDIFDDDYLGSKSSDPTVDNDGNALADGSLYYNTTDNRMKVYDLGTTSWLYVSPTSSDQTKINSVANAINAVSNVSSNLSAVQNFADVYRISATAPTSSLNVGDLYFDTNANELKVYKSSGWSAAGSTVNGTSARFSYTISGTPTTVSGADSAGNTLAYDAGFADVYLNGVRMSAADITITSGNSVVFASALQNGDLVDIVAYGTFNVASIAASNITSGILGTARGGTGLGSLGTAGQAIVVNAAANALEFSNASSAEVYGFEKYYNPSTLVKTVTVVGGVFVIDGVSQDTLDLYEGNTYVFNYPSGHPFKFSTTANGTHGGGSEYTTGVTHNSSTQVTIVVASGAPTLYYYCSSHTNMGGTANTPIPANNAVRYITTNQGQDNISESQYANFADVLFSASGFVFSVNTNGNLISTI
tara:strand:+ start:393 stop:2183 length:1791 start_codon:yes stop_codon:yes gene_type:complete